MSTMSQLEKARIYAPDESYEFYVQYNPTEISLSEDLSIHYSKGVRVKKGAQAEGSQHTQASPMRENNSVRLSASLFFNTYEGPLKYSDVRDKIKQFYFFHIPAKESQAAQNKRIGFAWGTLTVVGTLSSLEIKYTMFAANGTPVRAEVSIGIAGDYTDRKYAAADKKGKADISGGTYKGQSLSDILAAYKEPSAWKNEMTAKQKAPNGVKPMVS